MAKRSWAVRSPCARNVGTISFKPFSLFHHHLHTPDPTSQPSADAKRNRVHHVDPHPCFYKSPSLFLLHFTLSCMQISCVVGLQRSLQNVFPNNRCSKRVSRKTLAMFCVRESLVTPVTTRMQRLVCVRAPFVVVALVAMTDLVHLTFEALSARRVAWCSGMFA